MFPLLSNFSRRVCFFPKIFLEWCCISEDMSLYYCFSTSKRQISASCYNYAAHVDDEFEYDLKNVDLSPIAGTHLMKLKIIKSIAQEIDVLRQISVNAAPKRMSVDQWELCMRVKNRDDRMNYYQSCLKPMTPLVKDIPFGSSQSDDESSRSLFLPTFNTKINRILDYKLINAKLFGPHLIIDCRHEAFIKPHMISESVTKVLNIWFVNRRCRNPFDITFCNVDKFGELFNRLSDENTGIHNKEYILNVSTEELTDLFPSKKLVYLTPFTTCEMGKFNGEMIFVLGAFIDEIDENHSSLIVSKKYGLRTYKFPLNKFVKLKDKIQHLSADVCIKILNDVKNGANWQYAFRHLSRDKILSSNDFNFIKKRNKSSSKQIKFQRTEHY